MSTKKEKVDGGIKEIADKPKGEIKKTLSEDEQLFIYADIIANCIVKEILKSYEEGFKDVS